LIVLVNLGDEEDGAGSEVTSVQQSSNKELTQVQRDSIAAVERANMIEERKNATISAGDLVASYGTTKLQQTTTSKGRISMLKGTLIILVRTSWTISM
jgi:hypothetical protein